MGFQNDPEQQAKVEEQIRAARPHLLFVALGAPKQEYSMGEHARSLGVPIAMGVGGSFEMVGGIVNRAPGWVQNMGIEWLYRLVREPRRLWRRYLIGNVEFGFIVLRQWLSLRGLSGNSFGSGPVVGAESFRPAPRSRSPRTSAAAQGRESVGNNIGLGMRYSPRLASMCGETVRADGSLHDSGCSAPRTAAEAFSRVWGASQGEQGRMSNPCRRSAEDPLSLISRAANSFRSLWMVWTYPFASVGDRFHAHY